MPVPERHQPFCSDGEVRNRANVMPFRDHDPEFYYDRVMPAWRLIMGRNLHCGYFQTSQEDLNEATQNLTLRVANHARLEAGLDVLDVGCGDGATACFLAERFRCRIMGISTGRKGVDEARRLSRPLRLSPSVSFLVRDGMDNGFPAGSFDCVWVLQASHFMLNKRRLLNECVRVLRPGGCVALADIMLRAPLPMTEVVRRREEFLLLHRVFGRAKMEPLATYQSFAEESGLRVTVHEDISRETLPTFSRWRENAMARRKDVIELLGEALWRDFLAASNVLEQFWKEGLLGYGILAGMRDGGVERE